MRLTERDLGAIDVKIAIDKKNLSLHHEHLNAALDNLIRCNDALAESGVKVSLAVKDSETLLLKFILNSYSVSHLLNGIVIHSKQHTSIQSSKLLDLSSVRVLIRSQMENMLMFYHLYVNTSSEEETVFRYRTWILDSLLKRQKFPSNTSSAKKRKEEDRVQIDKLRAQIKSTEFYKGLDSGLARQIDGSFPRSLGRLGKSWKQIMEDSGFEPNTHLKAMYSHLSFHAHSEGLSVLQLKDKKFAYEIEHPEACILAYHSTGFVCLILTQLAKLNSVVKSEFESIDKRSMGMIEMYAQIMTNGSETI